MRKSRERVSQQVGSKFEGLRQGWAPAASEGQWGARAAGEKEDRSGRLRGARSAQVAAQPAPHCTTLASQPFSGLHGPQDLCTRDVWIASFWLPSRRLWMQRGQVPCLLLVTLSPVPRLA